MVLIIAAVGKSGSGKTTTLEYLVSNLSSEGYRVGAIKHICHKDFKIDKEGTNTWRYTRAGAKVTTAVSANEIVIIKKPKEEFNDLNQVIGLLKNEQLDVIVVEGFQNLVEKREDILKIITAKDECNLKKVLERTVQPIIAIADIVGKQKPEFKQKIPVINIPSEGEKLLKTVREYLKAKGN